MSFINPNFRNLSKKMEDEIEVLNDDKKYDNIEINFNEVKLEGEPRRVDIPNKEEIIGIEDILENDEIEYEKIDIRDNAKLISVPRIEDFPLADVAKIQMNYLNDIEYKKTL